MTTVTNIPSSMDSRPIFRAPLAADWSRLAAMVLLCGLLVLAAGCTAPPKSRNSPAHNVAPGTVSVTTENPDAFTPPPGKDRDRKAVRAAWVQSLSEYMADRLAEVLPEGERAEVHISDIRRAVRAQAAGAHDVVPPRIVLNYKRLTAKGKVIKSASRTLQDSSLQLKGQGKADDPLRYEKALIDDWVTREFNATRG